MVLLPIEVDLAVSVLGQHLIVLFAREGALFQSKHVEDDSHTEDVADRVVFGSEVLEVDDFWSDVPRGSASDEQILLFVAESGQSEVCHHAVELPLFLKDDILWLQIPVHDILLMHGFDSHQQSLHDCQDFLFGKCVFCLYLVVELASFQQLYHHVN